MKSQLRRCIGFVALGLLAVGCSRPMAQVRARVVQGGVPVSGAQVILEPDPSGTGSAFGLTQSDGTCQLDLGGRRGLDPGKYRISITLHESATGGPIPDGEEGQALKQSGVVVQKTYVLSEDLMVGPNDLTLDLDKAELVNAPQ